MRSTISFGQTQRKQWYDPYRSDVFRKLSAFGSVVVAVFCASMSNATANEISEALAPIPVSPALDTIVKIDSPQEAQAVNDTQDIQELIDQTLEARRKLTLLEKQAKGEKRPFHIEPVVLDGNDNGTTIALSYQLDYRYLQLGKFFEDTTTDDNQMEFLLSVDKDDKPEDYYDNHLFGFEVVLKSEGLYAIRGEDNTQNFNRTDFNLGVAWRWRPGTGDALANVREQKNCLASRDSWLGQDFRRLDASSIDACTRAFESAYEARKGFQADARLRIAGFHESRQDFAQTQWGGAAELNLRLLDQRDLSVLGFLNLADYVPALARDLTGVDKRDGLPQGRYFPKINIGLSRVNASDNADRATLGQTLLDMATLPGDASNYWRFNLDIQYRAPFAYVDEEFFGALLRKIQNSINDDSVQQDVSQSGKETKKVLIYLSARFRHFRELNPIQAVRDLGFHRQTRWEVTLGAVEGPYIQYARGSLPLDQQTEQALLIGWRVNFGDEQ